jgi:hypothetical protein
VAKKKKLLRLLKLLAKLQSKLAKLQSKPAKLLKKLLHPLLTLLLLLAKLRPLPAPLLMLLLHLHPLLPSNSWSRNKKNRPSGRFFYVRRKPSIRLTASASRGRGWV